MGGIALALLAAPALGTELGDLTASMEKGSWASLETEAISVLAVGPSNGNVLPYAHSASWDPIDGVLHFVGADHNASATPHVAYSEATNTWSVLAAHVGRNAFQHGYDHAALDVAGRTLYLREFGLENHDVLSWSIPSGPWQPIPDFPSTGWAQIGLGTAFIDGVGYAVYNCGEEGGQIMVYSPSANAWITDIKGFGGQSTYLCFAEFSPQHARLVVGGGGNNANRVWAYDVASDRVVALADAPVELGVSRANVTVDPATGNLLVLGYGQFWELDPSGMGTWTDLTGTRTPPAELDPVITNVISAPIASHNVNLYVRCNAADCALNVYKHTDVPPESGAGGSGSGGEGQAGNSSTGVAGVGGGGAASVGAGDAAGTDDAASCACRLPTPQRRVSGSWWFAALAVAALQRLRRLDAFCTGFGRAASFPRATSSASSLPAARIFGA
jgi:hypothetical protein